MAKEYMDGAEEVSTVEEQCEFHCNHKKCAAEDEPSLLLLLLFLFSILQLVL